MRRGGGRLPLCPVLDRPTVGPETEETFSVRRFPKRALFPSRQQMFSGLCAHFTNLKEAAAPSGKVGLDFPIGLSDWTFQLDFSGPVVQDKRPSETVTPSGLQRPSLRGPEGLFTPSVGMGGLLPARVTEGLIWPLVASCEAVLGPLPVMGGTCAPAFYFCWRGKWQTGGVSADISGRFKIQTPICLYACALRWGSGRALLDRGMTFTP